MLELLIARLDFLENFLWTYLGVPLVIGLGLYFSFKSRFFQIRHFPYVCKTFLGFLHFGKGEEKRGIHPLKAFFASVGGCVGIGNIVGICTAVQLGGPGALFWIWMTSLAGMILKYSEVYLGMQYRVPNQEGGYNGGPMYFLKQVFKTNWIPQLVCVLLCIYGVEVYQFSVVSASITENLGVNYYVVVGVLLGLVMLAGSGGVQRVGNISSKSLPLFVCLYVGMGLWVLLHHVTELPTVFMQVLVSAFTGHAAVGGFAGAGVMAAMSHGIRRGCYTGDVGVGYASVIQSESGEQEPEKQAVLEIFGIFLDTFIVCTTSLFLILTTGVWQQPMEAGMLVQTALSQYFPYMHFFMPLFLFMLGYNTINAYFCVGLKCAEHLSVKWGRKLYYSYAILALITFSFMGTTQAQTVMAIAGVSLLLINGYGMFILRDKISFHLPHQEKFVASQADPSVISEII